MLLEYSSAQPGKAVFLGVLSPSISHFSLSYLSDSSKLDNLRTLEFFEKTTYSGNGIFNMILIILLPHVRQRDP